MRVAIYARVSTNGKNGDEDNRRHHQDTDNQLLQLRAWCANAGHVIVREYVERVSGGKGKDKRPEFARMLDDAHKRQFDIVLLSSLVGAPLASGLHSSRSVMLLHWRDGREHQDSAAMIKKASSSPGSDVSEDTARILFLAYGSDAVEMATLRCAELKKAGDKAGLVSWKKVLRSVRQLAAANRQQHGTIN
jgi:hypothetical protein